MNTPEIEIVVTKNIINRLLQEQADAYAHFDLEYLGQGWDNVMYGLGENAVIRLPIRNVAVPLLENEQKFLSILKTKLSVRIPSPIYIGKPTGYFPYPWSINPWVDGKTANLDPLNNESAHDFIQFLKELHSIPYEGYPFNDARGVDIHLKKMAIDKFLKIVQGNSLCLEPEFMKIIQDGYDHSTVPYNTVLHGDLHPRNVVSLNGKLHSIIDWGDICYGDPATDLSSIWMLYHDQKIRNKIISEYNMDQAMVIRSKAWAAFFCLIFLGTGLPDNLEHHNIGIAIRDNLLADVND